jgi:hypothetical protein
VFGFERSLQPLPVLLGFTPLCGVISVVAELMVRLLQPLPVLL